MSDDVRLFGERRKRNHHTMDIVSIECWHSSTRTVLEKVKLFKKIIDTLFIISMEIFYVKGCIEWPEILFDKVNISDSSTSSCNDSRCFYFVLIDSIRNTIRTYKWEFPLFSCMCRKIISPLQNTYFIKSLLFPILPFTCKYTLQC